VTAEQAARPRGRARPAEELAVQAPVDATQALTGEVVGARVSPIEWALYGAFTVIGAIMRFWDLGTRALHHDESLHATYSWYLWECLKNNVWRCVTGGNPGAEYHYDPMMHGPYQFHGNALMYFIFGVNNASARLDAALCGTALIILPILLRRQLGRVAALILSGALAFSPAFLYYSRFSREDIYFALWTAVFFVGFIRWLDARGRPGGHRWLYMAAAGLALSWATKESAYFTIIIAVGFVLGVFAVAYAYQFLAPARQRGRQSDAQGSTLVATLGNFSRANLPPLLAAFRGTPPRAWWYCLGIIAAITLVLFWPLGDPWQWGFIPGPGGHTQPTTNAQGKTVNYNTDFLTGGLSYWKLQQDVKRGQQPWYYYFLVIPLYEQVAVVFGAAGLVYYFLQKRTRLSLLSGAAFVLFTALTLFVGPGFPKFLHYGLALLMIASGVALLVSQPRSLLVNLFLWWAVVTWALYIYAGEKMPWLTLHILLPTYVVAALYLGHLFRARRFSVKWLVTAALLALTALLSFRSAVALAYVDGANPTEMLVYTQTAQDVPNVSAVVHRIPLQPTTTGAQERVWVDNNDAWPWVWYLHDDPSNHGWSTTEDALVGAAQQRYPVVIVSQENHQAMQGDGKLAQLAGYTGYEFKLRWWFPEEGYRAWMTTGPGGFLRQAVQPATWAHLWHWWATRTPFDQAAFQTWSNVYPFYVYVRNDLVKQYVPASWASARRRAAATSNYTPRVLPSDVPAALTRPVVASLTVDGATLPRPMAVVRAVAVDAAGAIYLTDSTSQRVVKLDRAGHYLTSWGSPGAGPGQFGNQSQGPMGIAVGQNGDVYVADTWNHRVEEFSATGALIRVFGHPNPGTGATGDSFYGPRQLAVAPNGNIYVADTGNERIQVYSSRGVHLFNIGGGSHGPETALGRFDEPSGVAIDRHGVVYVADYWDKRIQRFTLDGKPLGPAFAVTGWATSDYSEPYLAVDTKGHLFATDAPTANTHAAHVLEMDAATGRLIHAFGAAGPSASTLVQPSGIAVGRGGALYIADAGAAKLLRVQP
jgi:uncharacterized protein (TIGR03663 family)